MTNRLRYLGVLLCLIAAAGCGKKETSPDRASDGKTAMSPASASSERSDQKRTGKSKPEENSPGNRGKMPPALVVVAQVRAVPFSTEVEALGTAKANEAVDIVAKISNRVTAIRFREGQAVRAGDVLIELDAEEARADLAIAEAALSDSRSQVTRSRELFATKSLSAQQMEQLESTLRANEARAAAARARLNEQFIRAPFGGRVGLRNVSVGSLVGPGTSITTLDDTSVMKVDFSVPETVLSALSAGMEVQAKTAAFVGDTFRGHILTVGSRVDPVSRSVTVRAQIPNREGKLKPGMFMTVLLKHGGGKVMVVPEEALVPERDKQFVFTVRDGKAYKAEIVVGRRRPGEVEVLQGLAVGDEVIIEGTQKVRDGLPVRVTPSGGGAEGSA